MGELIVQKLNRKIDDYYNKLKVEPNENKRKAIWIKITALNNQLQKSKSNYGIPELNVRKYKNDIYEEIRENSSLEQYSPIIYKCNKCGKEIQMLYSSLINVGKFYCKECNIRYFNNKLIKIN